MSGETTGFDPLAEARHNAEGHRKRYYEMVGDVAEFPDHGTFSKAHDEFANYLESRKAEGDSADGVKDHYENSLAETDQFAGKSLDEMAQMVAAARERDDKTGAQDAEDAFYAKFAAAVESGQLAEEVSSAEAERPEERPDRNDDIVDRRLEHYSKIMYGNEQAQQVQVSSNEKAPEAQRIEVTQEASESPVDVHEAWKASGEANDVAAAAVEQQLKDIAEAAQNGNLDPKKMTDMSEAMKPTEKALGAEGEKKGFDLDAEVAASKARTDKMAEQIVPAVEKMLDEKYPTIETDTTEPTKETNPEEPTLDSVLEKLRSSVQWKNATAAEREILEDEVANKWVKSIAERETVSTKKDAEGEPLTTLDEVLNALKESDKYKNASEEEQKRMINKATAEYIGITDDKDKKDSEDKGEKKDERTESEKKLDAFLEANKGLMDGLSDKEQERLRKILLVSIENGMIDKDKIPTPEETAQKAEAEKKSKIEAETKRIREELEKGELATKYKEALAKYAEAKADYDTKGLHIGRRKREQLLAEAESALVAAKLDYAKAFVVQKREASLYEGEANVVGAAMSNDLFDEVRKLDPESRASTEAVRASRIENRNVWQKGINAVGRFFNWGNKFGRGAKNVATGAATGFTIAALGAIWPVTAGAAAGASLLVRAASTSAYLDESLRSGAYKKALIEDARFRTFVEKANSDMTSKTVTSVDSAANLAGEMLASARQMGTEQNKQARRRASLRVGEFAAGFALGGLGGTMLHNALTPGPARAVVTVETDKEALKIRGLKAHIRPGEGGGEFAQNFLRKNGIKLGGADAIQAWDKATHGARVLDIFTQNGGKLDTYAMTGKFGGHAGLAYPGNVTLDHGFAKRLLEVGKAIAGK